MYPLPDRRTPRDATKRVLLAAAVPAWLGLCTTPPLLADIGDSEADSAYGQVELDTSTPHEVGPATLAEPSGIAIDRSVSPNRLYVSDTANSRVLGWSDVNALLDGAPADLVIGQPNLFLVGGDAADRNEPDTLYLPQGLAVDSQGSLYVASSSCHIKVFDDPFATDGIADLIFGDCAVFTVLPDNTVLKEIGPDTLGGAGDVFVDAADNLWIADTFDQRVLHFDGPVQATDTVADRVFGQPDFTTFGPGTLNRPLGVVVDGGGTLHVADWRQRPIHQFDDALSSDPSVDRSLGTPQCTATPSDATICSAERLAIDPMGRLWVADVDLNRVVAFESPHTGPATLLVGQPSFTSGPPSGGDSCNAGGLGAASLCLNYRTGSASYSGGDVAVDDDGRLYVADKFNHRVVRHDDPTVDSVADLVLGQSKMTTNQKPVIGVGRPRLGFSTRFDLVVDADASRVLVYQGRGDPVAVIGQPDLGSVGCNNGGRSEASLCQPTAAHDDGTTLWIADSGNNRVLRYDDWRGLNQVIDLVADAVYGQADFTTANCDVGTTGLCDPRGVTADATVVYVSDTGNHRVLQYLDAAGQGPLGDTIADGVFGQADLSSSGCNAGADPADRLCGPEGLRTDATGRLFVADTGNNRVLVFANAAAAEPIADYVYGQGGQMDTAACDSGSGGLCSPKGLAFDDAGNLYIADTDNHRVLEFDAPLLATPLAARVFGQPDFEHILRTHSGLPSFSQAAFECLGVAGLGWLGGSRIRRERS